MWQIYDDFSNGLEELAKEDWISFRLVHVFKLKDGPFSQIQNMSVGGLDVYNMLAWLLEPSCAGLIDNKIPFNVSD